MSLRDHLCGAAQAFEEVTGMSCVDFESLLAAYHDLLEQQSHLKFDAPERLLMAVMYAHLNATYSLLGELFDCHPGTVKRIVTPLVSALPMPSCNNHSPPTKCNRETFILYCPQAALLLNWIVPAEAPSAPPAPAMDGAPLLAGADSLASPTDGLTAYEARRANGIPAYARPDLGAVTPPALASIYLLLFSALEAITHLLHTGVGYVLYHALAVLMIYSAVSAGDEKRRRLAIALSLPPLMRIVSLGVPVADFPVMLPYLFTGFMMLLVAHMARKKAGYDLSACGIRMDTQSWPWHLAALMMGVAISVAGYLILRPDPLILVTRLEPALLPALVILFFSGFAEEFLYRGLIQRAAVDLFGAWGIVFAALVFAIMHMTWLSLPFVALAFITGLIFGWIVLRTGSILGAALAHGLINVIILLYLPNVLL